MAEDVEITKEVWDGKIPIVFRLALDEVTSEEPPEAYYLLAPRISYLTLVTDVVRQHFQASSIPDCSDEMWFEYKGTPLKWHYPIGVLFDIIGTPSELPWPLTVHFQFYPEEQILHCHDTETVETHYISMLKEADYLRYGSTKRTSGLLKREQKQLWESLVKYLFEPFWAINRKLCLRTETDVLKYIPLRIYLGDQHVIQHPFSPYKQIPSSHFPESLEDNEKTLGDLLKYSLPEMFDPALATSPSLESISLPKVLIQGISPSFETPIIWLSENMSHPDNFLHICILPPPQILL